MALSLKPSYAELVVSERNELIAKAKNEHEASRVQWISEAKMAPQLAQTLLSNPSFMKNVSEELTQRGVSMAFLAPSLRALENGSDPAKSIILKLGNLFNQFLNNTAQAAINSQHSAKNNNALNPDALNLKPEFIVYIDNLAESIQQQNRLVRQNLNDFDFTENEEQEIENDQQSNSHNMSPRALQNQPSDPAQNTEKKHSAHPGLRLMKHAAELGAIAKLAPKLGKGIEEEVIKEFSKMASTFTKASH
jgi:hypothetical protein